MISEGEAESNHMRLMLGPALLEPWIRLGLLRATTIDFFRRNRVPDELVGAERHCAVPRLPIAAVILVPEGIVVANVMPSTVPASSRRVGSRTSCAWTGRWYGQLA